MSHDALLQSMRNPGNISPGKTAALAERVEEALASPAHELKRFAQDVSELFLALAADAPADAVAAANGSPDASVSAAVAFVLGQIGFAQQVVSQAHHRRSEIDFDDVIARENIRAYISALSNQSLTGRQLAQEVGHAHETVSRNLQKLRELGVTEFRKRGTKVYNYLTPAAQAAFDTIVSEQSQSVPMMAELVARRRRLTSEEFLGRPVFKHIDSQQEQ